MTSWDDDSDPVFPEFDAFATQPFRGRVSQRPVPGGTLIEIFVPDD